MQKKKVLVTGTAGFIFGNFIRKAIYEKYPYDLVSIDRLNNNATNSLYWNKNHTFYIADICDKHIIDTIFKFEKPEIVIHAAASTHVDESIKDPNIFIHNNILGTQVIIDNCVKYKTERLVYVSSDEVYGALNTDTEESWKEDAPLNPRNQYSVTKAAGEMLVKAAHNAYGLTYNITRASNNYGPRQDCTKLLPKAIKCILDSEKIPIYGKGMQIREWLSVFDNCAAVLTILDKGKPNEVYNISSNQEYRNIEVVQDICNVLGKGHELISFISDPRNSAHDYRYSINCDKLKKLGWKPEKKFKEELKNTCNWYINNQWFLR
jgi:dTDP-glucose 4,6-dehydratase